MQKFFRLKRFFGHKAGILALFLFQLVSTLLCFKSPKELFQSAPIINIDWCSQYYWSFAGRRFFSLSHRLWGFDPYYMAGYPLDFIFNSSTPVQVANLIFWFFPLGLVIKWFFFISFLSVPGVFYLSLRNFGLEKSTALAGSVLGVSYFWLGENALFGNWGMLSGAWLLNFFLVPVSAFFQFLKSPSQTRYWFLTLSLSFALLLHKTFAILVGIPVLILLLIFLKKINLRLGIKILSAGIIALLVNSFWLIPFFHFLPNKIEDPNTTFFQNTNLWQPFMDLVPYPFPGVALGRLVIFIPAIYGIILLRSKKQYRELFWFTIFSGASLFLLVYFGSFFALLRHLQPYRYLTAYFFLLLAFAGIGLKEGLNRIGLSSQSFARGTTIGFFLFIFVLQFLPSFRVFYAVSPLTSRFPDKVLRLKSWLAENTDQKARIMMEDINQWEGKIIPYGPSRFVGLLPALLPRFLVGGPLPNAFIKHHYTSFHDGIFLNKKISDYSDQELKEKIDLYNIHWAIAWREESKARLRKFPLAIFRARFEELEVFEFQNETSWFLLGKGFLQADYDKIELKELKPENGVVVLKMHWLSGFKPEPVCELFRYQVSGDPVGFIGLRNPPREVELRYEP